MACASTEVRCELGGEPLCYPHDDDFELAFREIIVSRSSWSLTDKLFRIENWNFGVRTRLGLAKSGWQKCSVPCSFFDICQAKKTF